MKQMSNMNGAMQAVTDVSERKVSRSLLDVHPLLANRYSPRSFSNRDVTDGELELLLEAARWAPSSRNEQPWRFLVTRKGGEGHADMLTTLMESNRRWADKAPVLILCMATREFKALAMPNIHAWHDVGLAIGQFTFQATALGMGLHQLGGFDPLEARERFAIPDHYDLVSVIALGFPGEPESLPEDLRQRELLLSPRKPLSEIAHYGRFRG